MLTVQSPHAPRALPASPPALAYGLLLALIVALQFGPALGLLGFRLTGDERFTFNGAVRDALVAALLVIAASGPLLGGTAADRSPRLASMGWAIALTVVYSLLALIASSEWVVVGLNLRRMVLVPLLFVAVLAIPWTPGQIDRLHAWVVRSGLLVAALGLLDLALPDRLWTEILDIDAFNAANNLDRFGLQGFADSGRFFSGDLLPWTGRAVRRAVSTYLEPTTLGAGMATLLVAGLARKARGHRAGLVIALALACGVATVSKGFGLFLLLLLGWRWLGWPKPSHTLWLAAAGCVAALVALRWHLEGPLVHIEGLATGLRYLLEGHWRGEGIGAAGNYTVSGADFGEESGLGNVIAQVGVAAALHLGWIAALGRDVLRAATARRDPGGPWLAAWLLFWMATFLYSASSLGVGGNALGFLWLALYLHPASGPRGR